MSAPGRSSTSGTRRAVAGAPSAAARVRGGGGPVRCGCPCRSRFRTARGAIPRQPCQGPMHAVEDPGALISIGPSTVASLDAHGNAPIQPRWCRGATKPIALCCKLHRDPHRAWPTRPQSCTRRMSRQGLWDMRVSQRYPTRYNAKRPRAQSTYLRPTIFP